MPKIQGGRCPMMRELRKRMSIFLWIVAVAFILFIFLQWGMNVAGRKGERGNVRVVTKVNGIPIRTRVYSETLNQTINILRENRNLNYLDPLTERMLKENAFEELVQKAIVAYKMKENNIDVMDKEVTEIIKNSPPREILEDSSMYTNGRFDPQKYLEVLLSPRNRYFLYEQERRIKDEYPLKKLTAMYSAGLKVTQPEILKSYQEDSLKVKVSYIPFRVEDYLKKVSVTEQEIKDYYAVHKEEYKTGEGIELKSVMFEVSPSLADEIEAKREIDDIYTLHKEGISFDTLAITYSQDASSLQDGGNLGFVERGELEPEMEKVVFSLKEGEVSEPFQTSLGWHIAKVTESKGNKRKVSHILIKIVPGYETVAGAKEKVDNFKQQAKESGFEEAVDLSELSMQEIILHKEDGDLVPKIGKIIGINNFFFRENRRENQIAGPFVGFDGNYYIFQSGSYVESQIKSLEAIRDKIEEKVRREKALQLAEQDAKKCFELIKKGKKFHQAAAFLSKKTRTTGFFSMKDIIPGVPYPSEFYGLAFTLKSGNIGMTSTKKGYFIVKLMDREEIEKENFQKASNQIFTNLIMEKRNQVLTYWFQKLRKEAEIEDNRHLLDIY
jgi:peptidyl-prolyl cis-trans isomerase D